MSAPGASRRVAVLGGAGTVGRRALDRLVDGGVDITCLARPGGRVIPTPGVAIAEADLDAPAGLPQALEGVDTLLLITQMHPDEAARGLAAVTAARQAGVRKIVFQSVLRRPGLEDPLHFRSKWPIEDLIRTSMPASAIYRPNSFHQNDDFLKAGILAGVYSQPVGGLGVARVDARDVAAVAAACVLDPEDGHQDIEVHGPEAVTGRQVAEAYARALGRPVSYGGDDVEAWSRASLGFMAPWMVEALAAMYAYFQQHGMGAPIDTSAPVGVSLGKISLEMFVGEKRAEWLDATP